MLSKRPLISYQSGPKVSPLQQRFLTALKILEQIHHSDNANCWGTVNYDSQSYEQINSTLRFFSPHYLPPDHKLVFMIRKYLANPISNGGQIYSKFLTELELILKDIIANKLSVISEQQVNLAYADQEYQQATDKQAKLNAELKKLEQQLKKATATTKNLKEEQKPYIKDFTKAEYSQFTHDQLATIEEDIKKKYSSQLSTISKQIAVVKQQNEDLRDQADALIDTLYEKQQELYNNTAKSNHRK